MIDDFSREEWRSCARVFPDYNIYQTWAYQQIRGERDRQDVSRAIVRGEGGCAEAMCQVRIKRIRGLGVRLGYVQWGPLVRGGNGGLRCSSKALQALRQAYIPGMVDVMRLVPNVRRGPEGEQLSEMLASSGFERLFSGKRYRTLLLNVMDSQEQIRGRLHRSYRRSLKKAEAEALETRFIDGPQAWDVFCTLYRESVNRKGFKGLDPGTFNSCQQLLDQSEKMTMLGVFSQGAPLSVLLQSELGDTVVGLLGATSEAGLACGASYLVFYQAALSAMRAGMQWYDLGGIDPVKNPQVYQFKKRMGAEEAEHVGSFEAYSGRFFRCACRAADAAYRTARRRTGA